MSGAVNENSRREVMSAEDEWPIKTTAIWRVGMLLVKRLIIQSWSRFSL